MLEEVKQEEKTGYGASIDKKPPKKEEIADTYNDDFDEDIEEDIPVDDLLESNDRHGQGVPAAQSLGGFTGSQSYGVDPSVDSLALEDYDHVEPVERLS
mmetsp:Transcript_5324/g.4040  ORF Transcript_5324/g.4040 Transcript_5324/m.4040 type:complete len:99 (-) Transcript_5324:35-331(-)